MDKIVEKYVYAKTADIFINRIDCTAENIAKLIDVFEFKNHIEIVADMGFANEQSFPFEKIEDTKLQHKASFQKNKCSNGLFRLIASSSECKNFLQDIFEFDIEILCILGFRDESLWKQNLYYDNIMLCRNLIKQKVLDIFVSATIDEHGIAITLSREAYDVEQIVSKIKEIL